MPNPPVAAEHAAPMAIAHKAAFTALPVAALGLLLWLLLSQPLPLSGQWAWVPALGISYAWRIDGLSALMLLMITGVGSAVFVYAGGYMAGHPGQRRLFVLLSLFFIAMVGCVTADDIVVLFMYWEATSVLSFLLVGFEHQREAARRSAQQAMLVTGSGGLALLAGALILSQQLGTTQIALIIERAHAMGPTPALQAGLALVLVGAFTKSAQFPFHFWLPNAMAAPTPVSAFLHSATMVKLGVYLLGRLDPGFGEWAMWVWALKIGGSITAAWGMLLALRERDLKRILAWSTVATLGTLVMLVGLRGEGATVAVGALLLAHALYKAPLFFVAGNIDHGTGTRLIDGLGGLRHAMPWTAAAAALAGLSMAGIPLSFGFVVKDAIASAKTVSDATAFVQISNVVFGAIAVAVAAVAAVRVFWRHPGRNETPRDAHEGGLALVAPPLALAALGLVLGVAPFFAARLISEAASSMLPGTQTTQADFVALLALQPVSVFATLGVTLVMGLLIFMYWDPLHRRLDAPVGAVMRHGFSVQYQRLLVAIPHLAAFTTRRLQHGNARLYLATSMGAAALGVAGALMVGGVAVPLPKLYSGDVASLGVAGACVLITAGAVVTALLRNRLAMLLAAGIVGFGSAVLFLFVGAPDLAFTQFTVETVFVIVVAATLHGFHRHARSMQPPNGAPRKAALAEPRVRWGALAVALALALALTSLLLAATVPATDPTLTEFYATRSLPEAHGRNVVNVILVDFRAIDTFGESSVVLFALLAASGMLGALRRVSRGTPAAPAQAPAPLVLTLVATPMAALILLASIWVLLRGHNAPGGGFIAGLMAVTATVVWAFARGSQVARARMPLKSPIKLAALGMLLAGAAGVPALWLGEPFLTHLWGPLGLSTVLLFDAGVYLTVWGAVGGFALGLMDADPAAPSTSGSAA